MAEREIARLFGASHALLVASGTVAVELAVRALALPADAEVIVPALGWFATAAAVRRAEAQPVFVDVNVETSCLEPGAVEAAITPRTAALVAVHLHCAAAELDALLAIANKYGLALIEDCAQAHGTLYRDRPVGTFGQIGCFSFNQEKLVAVGEGGAVITSDDAIYQRLHALRTDGYVARGDQQRSFEAHGGVLGGNACASEFAAALLLAQLATFPELNARRIANGRALEQALAGVPGVRPLGTAEGTSRRSWHEFALRIDSAKFGGWTCDQIAASLAEDLGFPIHRTDEPTQTSPLLHWTEPPRPAPNSERLYDSLLVFHHRILLDPRIVEALPAALYRLQERTVANRSVCEARNAALMQGDAR
jgi:dTDP-4-amino-4,6-dideoxygalactose transaminase